MGRSNRMSLLAQSGHWTFMDTHRSVLFPAGQTMATERRSEWQQIAGVFNTT
jgi:hypothetical protein